jgi:hypothetical protein
LKGKRPLEDLGISLQKRLKEQKLKSIDDVPVLLIGGKKCLVVQSI